MGIILHFFKVLPIRKNNKVPSTKNFITELFLLVLLAILVSIPQVIELPAKFTKKPMHYDLIFSSKSSITVSKRTYLATNIGTEFYTVYQGSFLIDYFPTDNYFLKKD